MCSNIINVFVSFLAFFIHLNMLSFAATFLMKRKLLRSEWCKRLNPILKILDFSLLLKCNKMIVLSLDNDVNDAIVIVSKCQIVFKKFLSEK